MDHPPLSNFYGKRFSGKPGNSPVTSDLKEAIENQTISIHNFCAKAVNKLGSNFSNTCKITTLSPAISYYAKPLGFDLLQATACIRPC